MGGNFIIQNMRNFSSENIAPNLSFIFSGPSIFSSEFHEPFFYKSRMEAVEAERVAESNRRWAERKEHRRNRDRANRESDNLRSQLSKLKNDSKITEENSDIEKRNKVYYEMIEAYESLIKCGKITCIFSPSRWDCKEEVGKLFKKLGNDKEAIKNYLLGLEAYSDKKENFMVKEWAVEFIEKNMDKPKEISDVISYFEETKSSHDTLEIKISPNGPVCYSRDNINMFHAAELSKKIGNYKRAMKNYICAIDGSKTINMILEDPKTMKLERKKILKGLALEFIEKNWDRPKEISDIINAFENGKDFEHQIAIELFQHYYEYIAELAEKKGDYEDAIKYYKQAIGIQSSFFETIAHYFGYNPKIKNADLEIKIEQYRRNLELAQKRLNLANGELEKNAKFLEKLKKIKESDEIRHKFFAGSIERNERLYHEKAIERDSYCEECNMTTETYQLMDKCKEKIIELGSKLGKLGK